MRILFLVQNYPPEPGAVRYTHEVAVALARRGHAVQVITPVPHYPAGRALDGFSRWRLSCRHEDGVHVMRVPVVMGSNRQPLRRLADFLSFLPAACLAALTNARPAVVVASVPPPTVAGLGFALGQLWRVPVVQMLRDVEPHLSFDLRGMATRRLPRALVQFANALYARAARVVVVEPAHAALLRGIVPGERLAIIPRGLEIERFLAQARAPLDPPLPRRPGRALAVYLGTIGVVHALPRLVRAFADQALRALPLDLVLVGDGECAPECRRLIAEQHLTHITAFGAVAPALAAAVLHNADLLVASFADGVRAVGLKLTEYFAAGKPVLVAGTCAAADLVARVGNGWVCAPPTPASLHAALTEFLADPAAAAQRGQRGQAYARCHFVAAPQHDSWERLLTEVVAETAACSRSTAFVHSLSAQGPVVARSRQRVRPASAAD